DTVPTWPSDIAALTPLTELATVTEGMTVTGATLDQGVVTGSLIRTAATGTRWEIDSELNANELRGYTGAAGEVRPALVQVTEDELTAVGPDLGDGSAFLSLSSEGATNRAYLQADGGVILRGDGAANTKIIWVSADSGAILSADGGQNQVYADGAGVTLVTSGGPGVIALEAGPAGIDLTTESGGTVRVNGVPIGANPQPVSSSSATDILAAANTAFAAGTPVVGSSFTAPASGKVYVTVTSHMEHNTAAAFAYVAFEVRDGSTIGSGTVVHAANTDEGVGIGSSGTAPTRINAGNRVLITGLTPGSAYNARTMHLTTAGNFDIFYRSLLVEPVL
ncbi:hypothetical protein, partial [Streptomyces sp. NPDC003952]